MTDALSNLNRPLHIVAYVEAGNCKGRIDKERSGYEPMCKVCSISLGANYQTINEAFHAFRQHARQAGHNASLPASGPGSVAATAELTTTSPSLPAPRASAAAPATSPATAISAEAHARGITPAGLALDENMQRRRS